MNQKRGQVTFFVIIGIVIFVVVSMTIYLLFAAQPEAEKIPFEYTDVETFVTGCLSEAVSSGVAICSRGCTDEDLGGEIVTAFFDCTGFQGEKIQKKFPLYEIKVGNADIDIVRSEKKIEALLSFPVTIKREGKEHTKRTFRSQYYLAEEACIPCSTCEKDPVHPDYCKTQEILETTILDLTMTFYPGEFVGLRGGECLAC